MSSVFYLNAAAGLVAVAYVAVLVYSAVSGEWGGFAGLMVVGVVVLLIEAGKRAEKREQQ